MPLQNGCALLVPRHLWEARKDVGEKEHGCVVGKRRLTTSTETPLNRGCCPASAGPSGGMDTDSGQSSARARAAPVASEWRRERERAHNDIVLEVAALRQEAGLVQTISVGTQVERAGPAQLAASPAAGAAGDQRDRDGEGDDEGDAGAAAAVGTGELSATVPFGDPGAPEAVHEEPVPAAFVLRAADEPVHRPAATRWFAFGPGALRQQASHARTWCAKLGTAVMMQGVVQFLTGRVCLVEVALWRMQTASCAWHPRSWVDDVLDTRDSEPGAGLGATHISADSPSVKSSAGSRVVAILEWMAGGGNHDWAFAKPDAATIEARRDWSRDIDDEAFDVVAAHSFVWNRAMRPIIGIVMAQLLCAHCPKPLWGKVLMVALPFLHHPLKVISLRTVCPGWPPPTFWHLILLTLDSSTKTSALAGILPKVCSHLLVQQLRTYNLHAKIFAVFMQMRSFAPVTPAGAVRQAGGERGARPEAAGAQADEGEQGERAAQGGRGAQRVREERRRTPVVILEPLQRVLAAMAEDLILATVSYPLVVLERRMCVDVS